MRAGKLRHRIQVQSYSGTTDAYGQEVGSWSTIATVWADTVTEKGREVTAAGVVQAESPINFVCRWPAAWTPRAQLRVVFRGMNYDVVSATNVMERDRELLLMCRKGVNNG